MSIEDRILVWITINGFVQAVAGFSAVVIVHLLFPERAVIRKIVLGSFMIGGSVFIHVWVLVGFFGITNVLILIILPWVMITLGAMVGSILSILRLRQIRSENSETV